jgi:hypothetical protein
MSFILYSTNFTRGPRIGEDEEEDSDEEKDPWLDEYDERMELLAAKGEKLGSKPKKSFAQLEKEAPQVYDEVALKKSIVELLKPKESVTAALKRLAASKETMNDFNKLTDASQALIENGYLRNFLNKCQVLTS